MPKGIRDVLVALSLANVCFLSPWLVLLNPKHYTYYNWPADPGSREIEALLICVLLLGILFWFAEKMIVPVVPQIARLAFLVVLILPLNSFFSDYLQVSLFRLLASSRLFLVIGLALVVATVVLAYRYNRQLTRAALTLLIILSPLLLVNTVSVIWLHWKYSPEPQAFLNARPATPITTRAQTPRVVWIIFDELDQHTAFSNRASGLDLPEFDRFRNESLSAANAFPPHAFTLLSLPALITGHFLKEVTPSAANECELTLANGQKVNWSSEPSVLSQARADGLSTGLSGWYHPYCRVIGSSLDWCSWVPVVDQINPALDQLSLPGAIWSTVQTAVFRIPFVFRLFESRYERQRVLDHREELVRVSRAAQELLKQDLNLKLLHFPIPHHPWINDALGYPGNLVVADQTLKEVRTALESTSQWDSSIVLVTSDHWWRIAATVDGKRDQRIPFMLKLAGQKKGLEYQTSFNTILTRDLLRELLRGNLKEPDQVAAWIGKNSSPELLGSH